MWNNFKEAQSDTPQCLQSHGSDMVFLTVNLLSLSICTIHKNGCSESPVRNLSCFGVNWRYAGTSILDSILEVLTTSQVEFCRFQIHTAMLDSNTLHTSFLEMIMSSNNEFHCSHDWGDLTFTSYLKVSQLLWISVPMVQLRKIMPEVPIGCILICTVQWRRPEP